MTVDERELRVRIEELIANSRLTKAEFAERIGIDGPKLSKSLSGSRRFRPLELARVADLGKVDMDWLLRGVSAPSVATAGRISDDSSLADAVKVAEKFNSIARLLETHEALQRPVDLTPVGRPGVQGRTDIAQGQIIAEWARDHIAGLGLGDEKLENLEEICEEVFGINVTIAAVEGGIDGLTWNTPNFRLALINNRRIDNSGPHWTRQRFTLAHEIAHFLFADEQGLLVDENVMGSERTRKGERRANVFAAGFLMPSRQVQAEWKTPAEADEKFSRMLGLFGVSTQALSWRLFNLKCIDERERLSFSSLGDLRRAAVMGDWLAEYNQRRDEQFASRNPGLLGDAARDAYARGLIGVRPLAAALGKDVEDLLGQLGASRSSESPADADDPVFLP